MSISIKSMILVAAAALALAACGQQSEKPVQQAVPAATQSAPAPKPVTSSVSSTKPVATAPAEKPPVTTPSTPKSEAPVAVQPKPATKATESTKTEAPKAMNTPQPSIKPEAPASKIETVSKTTSPFSTTRCMACHAVDHDKVGPAWKTVVAKYGDEATLAKDFETGFKERRVANSIAKWKSKEGLMTMQYNNLIKGHGSSAAHALFETVKHGKFGTY